MKIISCNSNLKLANDICKILGQDLTEASVQRFADKEIFVEIKESVRKSEVFVIQSTCYPANDHIMELLVTLDTLKRASAEKITAVIPYYGYARQDRKAAPRTPITAKLVADLITLSGADAVLTMELHANQIQGFFDIPVDNLYASSVFYNDIAKNKNISNIVIVSPDVGGLVRARILAEKLGAPIAIVDKRREKAGISEVMNIIGDIKDKDCIIVDDIVDSGGTLCNAAASLLEKGARSVCAYITHGVLSGNAVEKINNSALTELVVTDSIDLSEKILMSSRVRVVTIAPIMADAIKRISIGESLSCLF